MKRTLRVVAAAVALLGMSFGGSPKAEAAAAFAVSASIQVQPYGYFGPWGPVGCPTGVNFVPPAVVDSCTPSQYTDWILLVPVGAITGSGGGLGSGVCFLAGEAEEQLAYGSGEVSGDCQVGGVVGSGGLTDCNIRYSRLGIHIVGVVSGCMTGAIVLQVVPDPGLRYMAGMGTMSGA